MPALCVIEGDGIGHEVVPAAVRVLRAVMPEVETVSAEAGWDCFLRYGVSVPEETLARIRACGAALFGAVASPSRRVEGYRSAIVTMRQALGLYANVRPIRSLPLSGVRAGVALTVVRENTEGLYSGRERLEGEDVAIAERLITRSASERIARTAFELAAQGAQHVTVVHKANVLRLTDGLFRESVLGVAEGYSDVRVDELLVDTAAMLLARDPERFDVIVTTNLFGDILSDIATIWGGGMGLAPSLNLGDGLALAEPVHGAAPDIVGQGIANPVATLLSVTLLLRHHWARPEAAEMIEQAIWQTLAEGYHTPDMAREGSRVVGTGEMVEEILRRIGK